MNRTAAPGVAVCEFPLTTGEVDGVQRTHALRPGTDHRHRGGQTRRDAAQQRRTAGDEVLRGAAPCATPAGGDVGGGWGGSVEAIVGNVKSTITRRINQMRHTPGTEIWQRDCWERVVRTPEEHARIEDYILANPARWQADDLHPDAPPNPYNQED